MIVQYLLHFLQLFPEKKMKREIRIRTQITVPKWIQFIVKSRAWHVKLWCISKRPVLCDHRQCLTFHERQPLLCFCGKSPTPTDVWTMPQESGQQTEHWTSNPHKSNQIKASVIWPKRAATVPVGWNIEIESISAGVHVRNECRVSMCMPRCFEHLLPCCFPNMQYGWLLGWWFLIDLNHRCVLISILHGLRTWLFRI